MHADAGKEILAVISSFLSCGMQMIVNVFVRIYVHVPDGLPLLALQVRLQVCFVAVSSCLLYPQVLTESAEVH